MGIKTSNVGGKNIKLLCNMSPDERLKVISRGLPLILENAECFYKASLLIDDDSVAREMLLRHADEEAAKILVLMDIARCPKHRIATDVGKMVKWFYDHLARLLYSRAYGWHANSISELKFYINEERKSHYTDGAVGEYIYPNSEIYWRESGMYVDLVIKDGEPEWESPRKIMSTGMYSEPQSLRIGTSLRNLDLLSLDSLRAISDIWEKVEFTDTASVFDNQKLVEELLGRVDQDKLAHPEDASNDASLLYRLWQMPMYDFDLKMIHIDGDEIELERQNNISRSIDW